MIGGVSTWPRFTEMFAESRLAVSHSTVNTRGGKFPIKIANLGDNPNGEPALSVVDDGQCTDAATTAPPCLQHGKAMTNEVWNTFSAASVWVDRWMLEDLLDILQ